MAMRIVGEKEDKLRKGRVESYIVEDDSGTQRTVSALTVAPSQVADWKQRKPAAEAAPEPAPSAPSRPRDMRPEDVPASQLAYVGPEVRQLELNRRVASGAMTPEQAASEFGHQGRAAAQFSQQVAAQPQPGVDYMPDTSMASFQPPTPPPAPVPPPGAGGVLGMPSVPQPAQAPQVAIPNVGISTAPTREAYEAQQMAVAAGAQAGAVRASETAAYMDRMASEAEARQRRDAEAQAQARSQLDEQMGRWREAEAAIAKDQGTVDANRWWGSRDTGQRIAAGISAFLGGMVGKNPIRDIIDRDIALQREQLAAQTEGRVRSANAQQSILGAMRQVYGDDIAAQKAAEATMLGLAQQRLQARVAMLSIPEQQAAAAKMIGDIEVEKAKALAAVEMRAGGLALERAKLQMQQQKAGAVVPDAAIAGNTQATQLSEDQRERFVPGVGLALDKKAAADVRDLASAQLDYQVKLGRLIALREKHGGEALPSDAKNEMRSLSKQLLIATNKAEKLGTLDNGTQGVIEQIVPQDPAAFTGGVLEQLKSLRANGQRSFEAKIKPYMATGALDVSAPVPVTQ